MRCAGSRREAGVSYDSIKKLVGDGVLPTGEKVAADVLSYRKLMPPGDESLEKLIANAIDRDRSTVADALAVRAREVAALAHDHPIRSDTEASVADPLGERPRLKVDGEVELLTVLGWIMCNRSDLIGVVLKLSVENARAEMVAWARGV
jgi:hypothetical protein